MTTIRHPAALLGANLLRADEATPIYAAGDGALVAWQEAATPGHIDAAVAAARAALPAWRDTSPAQRGTMLRAVASGVHEHREALAGLQQHISGKLAAEAEADVADVVACFNFYARMCEQGEAFDAELLDVGDPGVVAQRRHEPVGVAALVVPWNFPMVTTAWKLAPALAAGCTVVLKPSELTSPAELALLDLVAHAGVPAGVVNCVNGGAAVGAALVAHPGVNKISFTGSTAAGRQVGRVAAEQCKRVTLELGGKSSLIVRDDADLDLAVSLALSGAFTNAGQMCSATARILVDQRVHQPFLTALGDAVEVLTIGPLISSLHRSRVQALVSQGLEAGANVLRSGRLAGRAGDGYFMAPLLLACGPDNPLWRDEIFGPVACVRTFDSDAEALAAANDTPYGLVATVVTRSEAAAARYERDLRAGLVWVNTPQLIFPQVSWGGLGASGLGRELGLAGLRAYQELRHAVGVRRA
ncbi:aldehyde dehydrogenase family protein [Paucibacter sp. JuS9]|uniref:aldehyde dehydrogenase family protein n=1 Tax=Roseateles TaxID=93681 RepID=UPI002FE539D6